MGHLVVGFGSLIRLTWLECVVAYALAGVSKTIYNWTSNPYKKALTTPLRIGL